MPPSKSDVSVAPHRPTSHVLSLAIPPPPQVEPKTDAKTAPAGDSSKVFSGYAPYNPGVHDESTATNVEQPSSGVCVSHSMATNASQSSHTHRRNIDFLFSRWTQSLPPGSKTSENDDSMPNKAASSTPDEQQNGGQAAGASDSYASHSELCKKSRKIVETILETQVEKHQKLQSHEATIKDLAACEDDLRRQNDDLNAQNESIGRRLAKWKAGMIEMSVTAFRRLQGESERIAVEKRNVQEKRDESDKHRRELEHRHEITLEAYEERLQSLTAERQEVEKVLASLREEKDRSTPKTPVQQAKPIDMAWLNDIISHEDSSDEEEVPESGVNEDKAAGTTQTAESGPDVPPAYPTSSMADTSYSSDGIDAMPYGAAPSIKDGKPSWTCVRKGWKPPEKFRSGTNTLSYVTQLAGQNPIWFKASQDAYNFFLGASTKAFYTISLVPDDLASYETTQICWTVIAKTWATPTALTAAGWPFREDSIGNVWIHKDLNWAQITNLCQMSCSIFDNAIFEEARMILTKRSAASEGKKFSKDLRRFFRSISSEADVSKRLEPNPDHHPAFFNGLLSKENAARRSSKPSSP